jgi:hypothetical protein
MTEMGSKTGSQRIGPVNIEDVVSQTVVTGHPQSTWTNSSRPQSFANRAD